MRWFAILAVLFFASPALADDVQSTIDMFKKAPETKPYFEKAYGYAVFPTIGKGGIGIGGAFGKGKVFKNHEHSGNATMTQVTLGFQLGGQAFSQMVFLQDERAYNVFTSGSFEFSAQATAVALTAGANATASTAGASAGASSGGGDNAQVGKYIAGFATFTMAKGGLMYEATLGGQKFGFDPI